MMIKGNVSYCAALSDSMQFEKNVALGSVESIYKFTDFD